MTPIELLQDTYIRYLNTEDEKLIVLRYDRYNAIRAFAMHCGLITIDDIQAMETKILMEWEESLKVPQ